MIATLQMWALLEFCLQNQDMYDYILTTWHLLSDIIASQLFIRNNAKELKLVHLWPDTDTKINSSMEVAKTPRHHLYFNPQTLSACSILFLYLRN